MGCVAYWFAQVYLMLVISFTDGLCHVVNPHSHSAQTIAQCSHTIMQV